MTLSIRKNDQLQRLLAVRRMRAIQSNQSLITAFAIMCTFVVMITYLETSRMLIPTRVVSKQELRSLTSGFTNDLPNEDTKDDKSWKTHLVPHHHRPRAVFIGFSHCSGEDIATALDAHPDIVVNMKDANYFTGNISLRRYVSSMPPSLNHHVTVDTCWPCVTNKEALTKMKSFNKTIKVILVICDPILRLLSSQTRSITSRHKTQFTLFLAAKQLIFDLQSLKSNISVDFSLLNNLNARLLTEIGDYFRHIIDLYEIFHSEQVFIIERDKFRKNFVSELSRINTFLGVQADNEIVGLEYDKDKDLMCYDFKYGTKTCLESTPQNLTELFDSESSLLKSLNQFFKPFNRRLFLYLGIKFAWGP